jgi:predicted pyridoxine 5'-phosphate oxidase superfamily flavin-nucleotide-binding protein
MKIYNKNKVKSEKTLVKLYPDIAKEWHPSKNGDLTPTNVSAGSGKKYWFICKAKAHEYDAVLASRTKKGNECPYCSGHRACEDNCLQIKFPKIAEEWHPTKNGKVLPKDILPGSNKKHWFVCKKKKHEYQARIADRTRRGVNCSFCSGQKACPENCLQSKFPEIAADWHPTKNGTLTPQNVLPGSQKKCWFICKDKGHEYDASLHSKTNKSKNSGSPYCSGHRVGEDNCLQTKRPDVAAEWHPTKNGELTAKDVTPAAGKRIWFLCKKGHEYQSLLGNRTCQGIGCPYCSGAKASKDNCVKSTSLSASREWHPTKNENLTPDNVLPNSNKKVWFICSKNNHEYDMTVYSRIVLGIVCPYCSGHRPSKDICLQSNFPDIASEWHPTKNESLTPQNVLSGSQKKCWFICKDKSHEYESIIGNKTAKNYGCPFCSGRKVCLNNSLQAIFPNIAADWHPTKNGGMTPADVTSASGRTAWFVCKDKGHEYRRQDN